MIHFSYSFPLFRAQEKMFLHNTDDIEMLSAIIVSNLSLEILAQTNRGNESWFISYEVQEIYKIIQFTRLFFHLIISLNLILWLLLFLSVSIPSNSSAAFERCLLHAQQQVCSQQPILLMLTASLIAAGEGNFVSFYGLMDCGFPFSLKPF